MGQTLLSPWEGGRSTCSLDFIQSSVALVPLCSLAWGSVLRTNREWCRAQAFNHTAFFGSRAFYFCLGSHPPMDTEQYDGICLPFFISVHTLFTDSQKDRQTRLFDLPYLMKWERQSHSNLLVRIYDLLSFDREPAVLNLLCESSPALWLSDSAMQPPSLCLSCLSWLYPVNQFGPVLACLLSAHRVVLWPYTWLPPPRQVVLSRSCWWGAASLKV